MNKLMVIAYLLSLIAVIAESKTRRLLAGAATAPVPANMKAEVGGQVGHEGVDGNVLKTIVPRFGEKVEAGCTRGDCCLPCYAAKLSSNVSVPYDAENKADAGGKDEAEAEVGSTSGQEAEVGSVGRPRAQHEMDDVQDEMAGLLRHQGRTGLARDQGETGLARQRYGQIQDRYSHRSEFSDSGSECGCGCGCGCEDSAISHCLGGF